VNNYRPLNTFSREFEIIIRERVSLYLKSKFNPLQHGFIKSKFTSTNLVAYRDLLTPLVHSQRQVFAIYFDFSNFFVPGPHALLLHKLYDFGQAPAYITWFHSYITYRGAISTLYAVLSGVPQGSFLGPFFFYVFIYDLCSV